jgi:tetratricopeptide (TPR) repeat protein
MRALETTKGGYRDSISAYEDLIARIAKSSVPSATDVQALLYCRDRLAADVLAGTQEHIAELMSADRTLVEAAENRIELRTIVGDLRRALRPNEQIWWWMLDGVKGATSIWTAIAGAIGLVAFGLALTFANDVLQRISGEELTALAVAGTAGQIALALAAGTTFTTLGLDLGRRILKTLRLPSQSLPVFSMLVAILVLVMSLTVREVVAPSAAAILRSKVAQTRNLGQQIELLERASKLDPNDSAQNYKLARAYELLPDLVKAEEAYRKSIRQDPDSNWDAYLDLGHLLLSLDNPRVLAAWDVLLKVPEAELKPNPKKSWLKNQAWCYLLVGDPTRAEEFLKECVPEPGKDAKDYPMLEGHILTGMVMELKGENESANAHYQAAADLHAGDSNLIAAPALHVRMIDRSDNPLPASKRKRR